MDSYEEDLDRWKVGVYAEMPLVDVDFRPKRSSKGPTGRYLSSNSTSPTDHCPCTRGRTRVELEEGGGGKPRRHGCKERRTGCKGRRRGCTARRTGYTGDKEMKNLRESWRTGWQRGSDLLGVNRWMVVSSGSRCLEYGLETLPDGPDGDRPVVDEGSNRTSRVRVRRQPSLCAMCGSCRRRCVVVVSRCIDDDDG